MTATLAPSQRFVAGGLEQNPFMPISDLMRSVVITYFVIWRLLPTVAVLASQITSHPGYSLLIAVSHLLTEVLILLPFLLRRFAGTPIGWLHPLILPTVVTVSFGILRRPEVLLAPYSVWMQSSAVPEHVLMIGWPESKLLAAQLKLNFINLLAIVSTYAGFAVVLSRSKKFNVKQVKINGRAIAVIFVFSALIVLFFLQQQGGIISHMSTLAGGRFRMRALVGGHFLVLTAFLPFPLLIWYAFRPNAIKNPLFLFGFALVAVLQFVVTGSRSSLFTPVAMLLAVWIYHNRKLPAGRSVLLGLVALIMLGVLGEVRRSGDDGQIDLSALKNFNVSGAWSLSQEEMAARNDGTGVAICGLVPEVRGHLYGTTYVSVVSFWIPRSIWDEKPRGAGAHASALLFGGLETMQGYEGGGFPVDAAPEAYWNFSYPGVVVVHVLFGLLLGGVTRWLTREPGNPFALTAVVFVAFALNQPNSISLTPGLQQAILLYLTYMLSARISWKL